MDCVLLCFEDSDQVIEERVKRQLIRVTSDFVNIDNTSFKFDLKNSQIFSFLVICNNIFVYAKKLFYMP